jgi:ribosomal protein S27E
MKPINKTGQIVKCKECHYRTFRFVWKDKEARCLKCGGLVEILEGGK